MSDLKRNSFKMFMIAFGILTIILVVAQIRQGF